MSFSLQISDLVNFNAQYSLIRLQKTNYSSDFIKSNPIPNIDNEKPTKQDLKKRINDIETFEKVDIQDTSDISKTEVQISNELTAFQAEKLVTEIIQNPGFELFVQYPNDQIHIDYTQKIPFPMSFTVIIARLYQNITKHINIKIENDIDYLEQPKIREYNQIKEYLIKNYKQIDTQSVTKYIQTHSIEESYQKIYSGFNSQYHIQHYIYLDELLADFLQIGINCCSFNRFNQFKKTGIQLIQKTKETFQRYDYPSFYEFKLKNHSDNEIDNIIQQQKQYKESKTTDESQILMSTAMSQLQTTELKTTILTNQQPDDSLLIIQNNDDMKKTLINDIQQRLQEIDESRYLDDQDFMEKTHMLQLNDLTYEELKQTQTYIDDNYN